MSISHLKALAWLTALGLGGALGYYFYAHMQERDLLDDPVPQDVQLDVLTSIPEVEPPREDVVAYGKVKKTWHDMNWPGTPPPPPPVETAEDDKPMELPKKPVSDLLKVLLVQVDGGQPEKSMAHVKYVDTALVAAATSQDDSILTEGKHLAAPYDTIVVSAIRADGVHFSFEGGRGARG